MTVTRGGLIAALDVGSTKVCCFLAAVQEDGSARIVGVGHQIARGMRAGAVTDMEPLENSIRAAVASAEEMAGESVRSVIVNVSGGQPASSLVDFEVTTGGHPVDEADLRRMLDHGRAHCEAPDRELMHAIPVEYTIDGNEGVQDPRGMYGERLGISLHVVSAHAGPVRNLASVVNRCHLDIEARVVSPYASGLACLVEDEREMGVTCIDMGGGTTSIAVFLRGRLIHVDVIPIGGQHVTADIARGLTTPHSWAERLKTLYGSALPSPADEREMLKVPLVGEDEDGAANQIARSVLNQIIRPRIEETFEMVRNHLEERGLDRQAGRRVVLTGGGAQLQGMRDFASRVLDKQVRVGRPIALPGLPEATNGPAFSTSAGLIRYALIHQTPSARGRKAGDDEAKGGLGRIGSWLKRNF